MKQEKQQEIALMRYGAIAPIIAGLDERYPSKTAFYTEISAKGLMGPDGKLHHCLLYTSKNPAADFLPSAFWLDSLLFLFFSLLKESL